MLQLQWTCKPFAELTPNELYTIIRLRNEVFVVEQNCVFQDADNKDQHCEHLCGWDGTTLVVYARIVPPHVAYEHMSIGRIVNSPAYRGQGAGKLLLAKAIETCYALHGHHPIQIGAQLYLKKFYESFGFIQSGEVYDEDGIDHIEMIRK